MPFIINKFLTHQKMLFFSTNFQSETPFNKFIISHPLSSEKFLLQTETISLLIDTKHDKTLPKDKLRLGSFYRNTLKIHHNTKINLSPYFNKIFPATLITIKRDDSNSFPLLKCLEGIKYITKGYAIEGHKIINIESSIKGYTHRSYFMYDKDISRVYFQGEEVVYKGMEEQAEDFKNRLYAPLFMSDKMCEFGLKNIKGVLLAGRDGMHKSRFISYVAMNLKVNLLMFDFLAESIEAFEKRFEEVESLRPCIVSFKNVMISSGECISRLNQFIRRCYYGGNKFGVFIVVMAKNEDLLKLKEKLLIKDEFIIRNMNEGEIKLFVCDLISRIPNNLKDYEIDSIVEFLRSKSVEEIETFFYRYICNHYYKSNTSNEAIIKDEDNNYIESRGKQKVEVRDQQEMNNIHPHQKDKEFITDEYHDSTNMVAERNAKGSMDFDYSNIFASNNKIPANCNDKLKIYNEDEINEILGKLENISLDLPDKINLVNSPNEYYQMDKSSDKENVITFEDIRKLLHSDILTARDVMIKKTGVTFNDIGGYDTVKQILKESVIWPMMYKDLYKSLMLNPPSGIILYGPPGCSKTLLARAVANESKMSFISIKGSELESKWVGETNKAIRELFNRAQHNSPCIIFIDEIDAIAQSGDNENHMKTLSAFLTEMDGFLVRDNIIVIGATNRIDRIDKAFLRPGRIDKKILVDLPDKEARQKIFEIKLGFKVSKNFGNDSEGLSGAEITHICNEAKLNVVRRKITGGDDKIKESDVEEALEKHNKAN